jgi:hypothetical protein
VTVRNNVTNRGVTRPENADPSFVSRPNAERADIASLFRDAANGDFRWKPGAATGGVEKMGAFPVDEPDWRSRVGADWADVAAPTGLTGGMAADGTVTLHWKDNARNETAYVIERGYKTAHWNGGWEYAIAGRVKANVTTFKDRPPANDEAWLAAMTARTRTGREAKPQPIREWFYRVRAEGSYYSNTLVLPAGGRGAEDKAEGTTVTRRLAVGPVR